MIVLNNEEMMLLNAQLVLGSLNMHIGLHKLFRILKYVIFLFGLALYYVAKSNESLYKVGTTIEQMQNDRIGILFIFAAFSIICLVAQLINKYSIGSSLRQHREDIIFYLKYGENELDRFNDFIVTLDKCYKYAPKEVTEIKNTIY